MFTQIYLLSILGDVFMLLSCRTSSWPRLEYCAVHRLQMAVALFLSKDVKPLSKACSCALQSGLWEVRAQLVSFLLGQRSVGNVGAPYSATIKVFGGGEVFDISSAFSTSSSANIDILVFLCFCAKFLV